MEEIHWNERLFDNIEMGTILLEFVAELFLEKVDEKAEMFNDTGVKVGRAFLGFKLSEV